MEPGSLKGFPQKVSLLPLILSLSLPHFPSPCLPFRVTLEFLLPKGHLPDGSRGLGTWTRHGPPWTWIHMCGVCSLKPDLTVHCRRVCGAYGDHTTPRTSRGVEWGPSLQQVVGNDAMQAIHTLSSQMSPKATTWRKGSRLHICMDPHPPSPSDSGSQPCCGGCVLLCSPIHLLS